MENETEPQWVGLYSVVGLNMLKVRVQEAS